MSSSSLLRARPERAPPSCQGWRVRSARGLASPCPGQPPRGPRPEAPARVLPPPFPTPAPDSDPRLPPPSSLDPSPLRPSRPESAPRRRRRRGPYRRRGDDDDDDEHGHGDDGDDRVPGPPRDPLAVRHMTLSRLVVTQPLGPSGAQGRVTLPLGHPGSSGPPRAPPSGPSGLDPRPSPASPPA